MTISDIKGFKTEHGSEYTLYPDGTTQRNKKDTDGLQKEKRDLGWNRRSIRTCYISEVQKILMDKCYSTTLTALQNRDLQSLKEPLEIAKLNVGSYETASLRFTIYSAEDKKTNLGIQLNVIDKGQSLFQDVIWETQVETIPRLSLRPFELLPNEEFHIGHSIKKLIHSSSSM